MTVLGDQRKTPCRNDHCFTNCYFCESMRRDDITPTGALTKAYCACPRAQWGHHNRSRISVKPTRPAYTTTCVRAGRWW